MLAFLGLVLPLTGLGRSRIVKVTEKEGICDLWSSIHGVGDHSFTCQDFSKGHTLSPFPVTQVLPKGEFVKH